MASWLSPRCSECGGAALSVIMDPVSDVPVGRVSDSNLGLSPRTSVSIHQCTMPSPSCHTLACLQTAQRLCRKNRLAPLTPLVVSLLSTRRDQPRQQPLNSLDLDQPLGSLDTSLGCRLVKSREGELRVRIEVLIPPCDAVTSDRGAVAPHWRALLSVASIGTVDDILGVPVGGGAVDAICGVTTRLMRGWSRGEPRQRQCRPSTTTDLLLSPADGAEVCVERCDTAFLPLQLG